MRYEWLMAQIQIGAGAALHVRELDDGLEVTLGRLTVDIGPGRVAIGSAEYLSRAAVVVRQVESGRVEVRSGQKTGLVAVIRPDGTTVARLRKGEAIICGPGVHVIQVLNPDPCGTFVVHDEQEQISAGRREVRVDASEGHTVVKWSVEDLMNPEHRGEWRTIAALAVIAVGLDRRRVATTSGASRRLLESSGLWFGRVGTNGWLSDRLDGAIAALGLTLPINSPKIPAIAQWMADARPLDGQDYALIRERLKELSTASPRH